MSQPGSAENGGDGHPPPDVDTTLLESLFYNEMMMLDDSSELLSTVTGAGGEANANIPPPPIFRQGSPKKKAPSTPTPAPSTKTTPSGGPAEKVQSSSEDPITFAEQSLLRDFGVTDSPFPHLSESSGRVNSSGKSNNQQQVNPQQKESQGAKPYQAQQQHHPHHPTSPDPNSYTPPNAAPAPGPVPAPAPAQQQHYHHSHNQYQHHQHHSSHHYPSSSGHPTPQYSYQNGAHQQAPIQPRPSPKSPQGAISSKGGIKHSVTPRQTQSPQTNQKPVQSPHSPSSTIQNPIPNPLANQHQSQPPHPHPQHQSHPHPQHPPTYHHSHPPHPHHQAYPHHAGQPAYHYGHPPPSSAPSLVPVPAPATGGHHQQSAYGQPPPPTIHGSAPPPYGTAAAPPHAPHPAPGHPPPPPPPVPHQQHHPHAHGHPHPGHPPPHTPAAPVGHAHPHAHAHAHAHPHPHHHHHHHHPYAHVQPPKEQLVSQFATLANRLGINLPKEMLSSLTKSAGMVSSASGEQSTTNNSGSQQPYNTAGPTVPFVSDKGQAPQGTYAPRPSSTSGSSHQHLAPSSTTAATATATTTAEASPSNNSKPLLTQSEVGVSTPEAEALRKTAEEAIAAVTRKRGNDEANKFAANPQGDTSAGSGGGGANNKSSYAKRRKKPRMADCESRLAQLRAENEKLKRHLDNITNKTAKNEQNRIKAEETMKQMMENSDTPNEELDAVIREYTEAYSDYGRRRHEELSFHLEQLQKLANPTNFTKMALWTIAKANDSKDVSKQNPLIGILQKELNISPPQVRKILDQRQKIRDLCSNLGSALELIHQLKDLCEQKNKKFNDRMSKTREILTPKQVVKLIMWIKDYSDVLGNICPGWTSEQMMKRKSLPKTDPSAVEVTNLNAKEEKTPAQVAPVTAPSSSQQEIKSTPREADSQVAKTESQS